MTSIQPTPDEGQPSSPAFDPTIDPSERSIWDLLGLIGNLKPGSLAKFVGGLTTVVSGIFAIGFWAARDADTAQFVRCYQAIGYPLGVWDVSGSARDHHRKSVALAESITFTGSTNGTFISNETDTNGTFRISEPLQIGRTTQYEVSSGTYQFTTPITLVVSKDGCTLSGQSKDSNGNVSTFKLRWAARDEFLVRR
jgi:hypothetical protein